MVDQSNTSNDNVNNTNHVIQSQDSQHAQGTSYENDNDYDGSNRHCTTISSMWSQRDPSPVEPGKSEEIQEQMVLSQILNQPEIDVLINVENANTTTHVQEIDSVSNTNIKFPNDLPGDVLLMISLYLKQIELISLSQTCKFLLQETDSMYNKKMFDKCWQLYTKNLIKASFKKKQST